MKCIKFRHLLVIFILIFQLYSKWAMPALVNAKLKIYKRMN